jgi:hypothetical protein
LEERYGKGMKRAVGAPTVLGGAWSWGVAPGWYDVTPLASRLGPDFFILAQALIHSWPHLADDRYRTKVWAGLDWIWP